MDDREFIFVVHAPLKISIHTLIERSQTYERDMGDFKTEYIECLGCWFCKGCRLLEVHKLHFTSKVHYVVDALSSYEIPPVTNKDVPMDDIEADDSEVETDEELNEVLEDNIYEDLLDLGETIVK